MIQGHWTARARIVCGRLNHLIHAAGTESGFVGFATRPKAAVGPREPPKPNLHHRTMATQRKASVDSKSEKIICMFKCTIANPRAH